MSIMKDFSELRDLQKALYRAQSTARRALPGAEKLDDKVRMTTLIMKLDEIVKTFRLQYYELEDAISFAKATDTCRECNSIIKATGND